MCFISYSWVLMTVMMVAMLFFLGPRHPRVLAEYEPLGRGRYLLFALAIVIFILCFTPDPDRSAMIGRSSTPHPAHAI